MYDTDENVRHAIRMSPCPVYDISGMECWLEEMARQGLLLCRYSMGLAVFEKREPARVRYQLALLPGDPLMEKGIPTVQDEMIALCEEYGWHYVTKRGRFGIFETEDETARTLYSDAELASAEYEELRQREKSALRSNLLWLLIIAPLMLFKENILQSCLMVGTELYILLFAAMTWHVVNNIRNIIQLRKLEKQLQSGQSLRECRIAQHPTAYQVYAVVPIVCFTLLCILLMSRMDTGYSWLYGGYREAHPPLASYTEPLPFARLEDIIADGVDIDTDTNDTIQVEHDILAPLMLTVSQQDRFRMPDGSTRDYGMYAKYYEMLHPALAMRLAKEQQMQDKERWETWYQLYMLPDLGVDKAVAYHGIRPTLILVEGSRVLVVMLDEYDNPDLIPLEQWSRVFAESLKI
ncbi:MAG: DUF2812 domain-containing protein [Peptococcaceae bacterium]|nr:DUF2812 domain-containing protein [Peptococcaceae bacterium]